MSEQKTPLIYERIAAVMNEIRAIDKMQKNETQRFMFRGIDDVLNGVQPSMAKHQVFVTQNIISRERIKFQSAKGTEGVHCIYQYEFTFWTIDGSFVKTYVDGEGMDYGDKAANKCGSIALKYALINTLLIPTKELDDPDAESHEVATQGQQRPSQPANLVESMLSVFKAEFGVDRVKIESYLGTKAKNFSPEQLDQLRGCFKRLKEGEPVTSVFKNDLSSKLL
jgi:hypothetical protein